MTKRYAAALLAVALFVTACGRDSSSAPVSDAEREPARESIEFEFADIDNPGYTMLYEPVAGALPQTDYGLNMAQSTDSDWVSDVEFNSNYIIYDSDTKTQRGTVQVRTGPPDPAAQFGTSDPEEITDAMRPSFFPARDVHESLRRAAVEDFGYKLLVEQSGTAYGLSASYIEFVDEESQNHALRFYMSNDQINENFYSMEIRADLPAGDQELIDLYRAIIFSLHPM